MRRGKTREASLVLALALAAAGCASEPGERGRTRIVHGQGFVVLDDASLEPAEEAQLLSELADSRTKILHLLGKNAAPGDFRTWKERSEAACPGAPLPPASEIRVAVVKKEGRCHADETGLTIRRDHLKRKDATHELVHYLAGASWRPVDEGLAVWLTEKLQGPAWGVPVDVRARVYFDLGMDDGLDCDRMRLGMNRRDYDLAGSFVRFLIEERGMDAFMALYRSAPGDYHTVFGTPELELLAKWREKIRSMNVRQDASYYRFKDYLVNLRSADDHASDRSLQGRD